MTAMLRIVCRVISRRVEGGENVDKVLTDYPRLTPEEVSEIKAELGVST